MGDLLLVKLGGSLITDKTQSGSLRPGTLRRLAAELADGLPEARRRGRAVILGHGSGSFGHVAAARHGVAEGLAGLPSGSDPDSVAALLRGAASTQARAAELHALVLTALRQGGLAPFSIAPSSCLVTSARRPARLEAEPLVLALQAGMLPVVYGDVVADRHQGVAIASTETVFQALVETLPNHGWRVREVLWLGRTAGVYDGDGHTLEEVRPGDGDAHAWAGAAEGTDVTGGMSHRLEASLDLARREVTSCIADGTEPGLLRRYLAGETVPGTRVEPD